MEERVPERDQEADQDQELEPEVDRLGPDRRER
jgi:hypothetical protein